ncbi:ABC transporter permease [Georgenia subflava]|uniref:ABC transporter permease subunit n=1 Tax=Georgenia subflava TaxID=1622177 RepID=A0A6N7EJK6_9MICO|nr:ABC transporter permease [Georgenia subflava]MPV36937.1 ABC transporter permease subunit [Georgenia subflava]
MLPYLSRRFLNYLVLLFLAVSLTYILAATQLEPRSLYELRNPPIDPVSIENSLTAYNLNDKTPVLERYWTWLTGVITSWDWGRTPFGNSVNDEIGTRVWVSLRLVTLGSLLGITLGVALGAWTATRQYKISDRAVTLISLIIISTPTLVIAVVLQILAIQVNQATGSQFFEFLGETGRHGDGALDPLFDRLQHLLLPTITLTLNGIASYSRIQRNLMLDTLGADYVRTARAKGLRKGRALSRHALRTALIPTGTYFAFTIATLVLGTTFVELIYGWHGMGIYGVQAITAHDVNGSVAVAAFGGVCVLVGAMLSDVLVAALDPRVRVS